MPRALFTLFTLVFVFSCDTAKKDNPVDSGESTEQIALRLAKSNIIVDGHVDLPYRMEVKGFMLRKEVEDVSVGDRG